VLAFITGGTFITVRYQYEVRQRLSEFFGAIVFAIDGSAYTLLFTSVVRTVPGTVAAYQSFGSKDADDTFSPSWLT